MSAPARPRTETPPIWSEVVAQPQLVETLVGAAADAARILRGGPGPSMTHAWLVTGPPGSGRSTAARVFAAALQCPEQGCGDCESCRRALARDHPDIDQFTPEKLQITAEESLALIHRSALTPMLGRWNVLILEDTDRLNDVSGNALLKSLEEPGPHTVWVLCAPTPEDVLPTIVSRARHLRLRTPTTSQVTEVLVARDGVDPALASFAARAAQGHIGRARALARDEQVRLRRAEVLAVPGTLRDLGSCFIAAQNLLEAAISDARAITDPLDAAELERALQAFGEGASGTVATRIRRMAAATTRDLEARQKSRRTRTVRDQLDRALLDLTGLFRDVLVVQSEAEVDLINDELRPTVVSMAAHSSVAATMNRLSALDEARLAVAASVAPQLAMEALMVKLARGSR